MTAQELHDYLRGSAHTESQAAMAFDVEVDEVSEMLVEAGVFCCPTCGWWADDWDGGEFGDEYICSNCLDDVDRQKEEG